MFPLVFADYLGSNTMICYDSGFCYTIANTVYFDSVYDNGTTLIFENLINNTVIDENQEIIINYCSQTGNCTITEPSSNSTLYFLTMAYTNTQTPNTTLANETDSVFYYLNVSSPSVNDVSAKFYWNGTESEPTKTTGTNTHNFYENQTIPLVQLNETNIGIPYYTLNISYENGNVYYNSTYNNLSVIHSFWIDSFATDSANYVEGENADLELYIKDVTGKASLTSNFTFYYNGSYWATSNTTSYSNVGGLKLFERTFNTLSNTNNTETKDLIANLTIRFDGQERVIGIADTIDVYKMGIFECGGITNTTTLAVSYWDELDFDSRMATLGVIRFVLTSGGVEREYSFENLTSSYNHTFCIYPSWATHNSTIYFEYEDSDTPRRPYYVVDTDLSDELEEVKAFLLNDTYAYYTNIYLYDENGASMPQYYIRILKYNPEITASETLFIGRTDEAGIFATFLRPLEQPYSYVVTDSDGEILYQTDTEVINCLSGTCPPYEKHIYVEPIEGEYINIGDIQAIYNWNETTSTLTMTISDSDGLVNSIWVKIDEMGEFGQRTNYFNQTYDSATLSFSEVLPNTTEEYEVSVKVEEFGEWYPLITRSITMENIIAMGVLGILIAFILTLSLQIGGLVLGGPVLGLVGIGGGLFISRMLNLIPLPLVGLYSVIFVIGMVIYLLTKGD